MKGETLRTVDISPLAVISGKKTAYRGRYLFGERLISFTRKSPPNKLSSNTKIGNYYTELLLIIHSISHGIVKNKNHAGKYYLFKK